ncbi:MAG: hypothetical protein B7Y99_09020 [Caulobacterales bacterium 32-69-10]|nr:MAG: hypothetical protein B7Y99_09020 [Caulobacterales bacterium 32-69-10]
MKSFQDSSANLDQTSRWSVDPAPAAQAQLGCELKTMFDSLTAGPLPDRLVQLADALEEAFRRGELFDPRSTQPDA